MPAMEVDAHPLESSSATPAPRQKDETRRALTDATDWIYKYRNYFYGFVVAGLLLSFNGQWRVGKDSALYRGLGHSVATGHGFTFSDFGRRQIYPGLPVFLAGLEKGFGRSPLPAILIMNAMAVTCLFLTYRLIRLHFPPWIAVAVTTCVGVNGWFVELANEILTDIPFLLGLLLALYGWEKLRLGAPRSDRRSTIRPVAYLLIGLALAATMRPTFWIVVIAWAMVCIWGLFTPNRKLYGICLAALLAVWVIVLIADPRTKGFNPLAGGYERDALNALQKLGERAGPNFLRMISAELSYGFFGQKWLPGMTQVFCLAAVGASLLLARVNPLWTLLVLLTVIMTLVMSPVPRYYTMVLPLMALAWVLLVLRVAELVPANWSGVALVAGLCFLVIPNYVRVAKVIGEQRAWHHSKKQTGPKDKEILDMADKIRLRVPEEHKVIGPSATIMAYMSGRPVLMQKDILPDNMHPADYPEQLHKAAVRYAVFPPTLYAKGERVIRDLMEKGVIVPVERIDRTKEMVLARVKIVRPPGDWRNNPTIEVMTPSGTRTVPSPTTKKVVKRKPDPAVLAARAKKALKAERAARYERQQAAIRKIKKLKKQKKEAAAAAAAAAAATRPATVPATGPATARVFTPRVSVLPPTTAPIAPARGVP